MLLRIPTAIPFGCRVVRVFAPSYKNTSVQVWKHLLCSTSWVNAEKLISENALKAGREILLLGINKVGGEENNTKQNTKKPTQKPTMIETNKQTKK